MTRIIMLRGLPASGKSTWAKEFVLKQPAGTWKRINKDDMRSMFDAGKWSRENEAAIIKVRDQLIQTFVANGTNVIVDDTNLAPKHAHRIVQLSNELGATFEIKDFFTDVKECIERDTKRANGVGKDVIWDMWKQSFIPKVDWPSDRNMKETAVICDLDGTLAEISHRSPYDASQCEKDGWHTDVKDMFADLVDRKGAWMLFVSGRSDKYKAETLSWLQSGFYGPFDLHMRKEGDMRKDWLVKFEILRDEIAPRFNPVAVFDDRDQVVAMWRAQGLRVYQVADGNF
jgi:predicted kinase